MKEVMLLSDIYISSLPTKVLHPTRTRLCNSWATMV